MARARLAQINLRQKKGERKPAMGLKATAGSGGVGFFWGTGLGVCGVKRICRAVPIARPRAMASSSSLAELQLGFELSNGNTPKTASTALSERSFDGSNKVSPCIKAATKPKTNTWGTDANARPRQVPMVSPMATVTSNTG